MIGNILSWVLGTLSNIVWLFVFIPQLIENWTKSSSDSISFYLVFLWYVGDTLSIVSIIYKSVQPILFYIGIYHVMFDTIFLLQILYYRLPPLDHISLSETYYLIDDTYYLTSNISIPSFYYYYWKDIILYIKDIILTFEISLLLGYSITVILSQYILHLLPKGLVGEVFAWGATAIFLLSRIPQIMLNYKRKSVNGLSFTTFINIIIANQLFLVSILIHLIDLDKSSYTTYLLNNLPWIIGSCGSTLFDFIIFGQFLIYSEIYL